MRPLLALGACQAASFPVVGLARQTRHPRQCSSSWSRSSERTDQRRPPAGWPTTSSSARCRTAASHNGSSGNGSDPSSSGSRQPPDESEPEGLAAGAAETARQEQGHGQQGSWRPAGRWLAIGGSVAAVLALTVFRREVAPALRWLITQVNNLTDKSLIGEAGEGKLEGILTLLAVALTLYWSFNEFAASNERSKVAEGLEARVAALEAQLDDVAAELVELRKGQSAAGRANRGLEARPQGAIGLEPEVDRLAAELTQLRKEREEGSRPQGRA